MESLLNGLEKTHQPTRHDPPTAVNGLLSDILGAILQTLYQRLGVLADHSHCLGQTTGLIVLFMHSAQG